ncbi:MAG: RsiV family protein, partial [Oscillospiraceae bacterium]|nr:RsiV family protein [Oscillospiraceae bacterium]
KAIPALLLSLLLLTACQRQTDPAPSPSVPPESSPEVSLPAAEPSPTPTPEDEIFAPDMPVDEDFWEKEFRDEGTDALVMRVSIALPQPTDGFPQAVRNHYAFLRAEIETQAEDRAERARAEYEAARAGGQDFLPVAWEGNYSVERNDGRYLSVRRDDTRFDGGLRDIAAVAGETFDLATGAIVTLDSLAAGDVDAFRETWAALVCAQIAPDAENYFETYEQLVREIEPQFCLTEEGLSLYYQVYEIAPYTMGVCQFDIPRTELDGLWTA